MHRVQATHECDGLRCPERNEKQGIFFLYPWGGHAEGNRGGGPPTSQREGGSPSLSSIAEISDLSDSIRDRRPDIYYL